jgi:hypothetical protein
MKDKEMIKVRRVHLNAKKVIILYRRKGSLRRNLCILKAREKCHLRGGEG